MRDALFKSGIRGMPDAVFQMRTSHDACRKGGQYVSTVQQLINRGQKLVPTQITIEVLH